MARRRLTTEEGVEKAKGIHKDKYDYSLTIYNGDKIKVEIVCPEHGSFGQGPKNHIKGRGCNTCATEQRNTNQALTTEEGIKQAKKVHGDKYDYSKVTYINSITKVEIVCSKHGSFWQKPTNHISRKSGCPKCNASKGELLISQGLKDNNIRNKEQYKLITPEIARNTNLMIIDFFIIHNDKQYFIEYDGAQHFEYIPHFHSGGIIDFEKQQRRDKVLDDFCELHNDVVTLIRFNYKQSDEEIISRLTEIFKRLGAL